MTLTVKADRSALSCTYETFDVRGCGGIWLLLLFLRLNKPAAGEAGKEDWSRSTPSHPTDNSSLSDPITPSLSPPLPPRPGELALKCRWAAVSCQHETRNDTVTRATFKFDSI